MTFGISKTPNCAQNPTFTLSPSLTFITRSVNVDGVSGKVTVNGATLSDLSTNAMTLSAVVDGVTASVAFTVIIKDPCSRSVFQTMPAPLSDMTVTMPSAATST